MVRKIEARKSREPENTIRCASLDKISHNLVVCGSDWNCASTRLHLMNSTMYEVIVYQFVEYNRYKLHMLADLIQ